MNFSDRPQPVLAGQVGAVITALVGIAVAYGLNLSQQQQTTLLGLIAAIVPLVGTIGAWRAARKVTPLASPRDDDGTPLVRAVTGQHRAPG